MTDESRGKILERVRKLIDKADDRSVTREEAEAFRLKADELMLRYAIEQAELERVKGKPTEEPISRSVQVASGGIVIRNHLADLMFSVSRHNRCRSVSHGYNAPNEHPVHMTVVGFEADVEFAEMLFTSLRLEVANRMWPSADPSLSYTENLILLKESGLKWKEIHHELHKAGLLDEPFARNVAVRFTKEYTKACKERGRERMYVQPVTHQRSWMTGFNFRIEQRLRESRRRTDEGLREATKGRGVELVLRSRTDRVEEVYESLFPNAKTIRPIEGKLVHGSFDQGDRAGKRVSLGEKGIEQRAELA